MAAERRWKYYPRWQLPELRILDRHVAALVEGRYRRLMEAVVACKAELDRERKRRPDAGWPSTRRPLSAVRWTLRVKALAAGWQSLRVHWSPEETAVLERHVRALLAGRFHDSWSAARACVRVLERRRRLGSLRGALGVARTPYCVRGRLILLARKLGWTRTGTRWLPEERAIIERFARALAAPGGLLRKRAGEDCFRALGRLHERLRVSDPPKFRRIVPHVLGTVEGQVSRRAAELGRQVKKVEWSPDEDRVVLRYARALVAGRYPDGPSAARLCQRALARRRSARIGPRAGATKAWSLASVYRRLCRLAHGLDAPWPHTAWTARERRACRGWVRWYDRYRSVLRLAPVATAAAGLQEEIGRLNCRRTVSACATYIRNEWLRLHGLE